MVIRPLLTCLATVLLASACTQIVEGSATKRPYRPGEDSVSPVDVETVMLDQAQMRAITGAGGDLTIIPTMDSEQPVDLEPLTENTPPPCRWIFAETETFGPDVEEFRKTTFQNPPDAGLISEGAAGYRDAGTARAVFENLVGLVEECGSSSFGSMFVGASSVEADLLRTRQGDDCGRDYRVKFVVLVEVTFCGFPPSVPDIVAANMLANVPD